MAGFTNKSDEWQQENWYITTNGSFPQANILPQVRAKC